VGQGEEEGGRQGRGAVAGRRRGAHGRRAGIRIDLHAVLAAPPVAVTKSLLEYEAAGRSTRRNASPPAFALSASTTRSASSGAVGKPSSRVPECWDGPIVRASRSGKASGWLKRNPVTPYKKPQGTRSSPVKRWALRTS